MPEGTLVRMHSSIEHASETSFSYSLSEMQYCRRFKLPTITTVFVKERRQGLAQPLEEAQGCNFIGENGRQRLQPYRQIGI